MAPGRSPAARLEGPVTHFSNICDPLGASGPSCFTIFPIFFAISAKFTQKNKPPSYLFFTNRCFCLYFMLQSTKNHWKSLKTLYFFNDFIDFTDFRFSGCWRQFRQFFRWFSRDLAIKMIVEALICFPLASLGSNWRQLSAFLGQSWTPQSLILDALPCLGNIFVA